MKTRVALHDKLDQRHTNHDYDEHGMNNNEPVGTHLPNVTMQKSVAVITNHIESNENLSSRTRQT